MATTEHQTGDKLVYPNQGVVEVLDIEMKDIAGTDMMFYVLRVLGSERKIMVPVQNAEKIGLRSLISESEIDSVFAVLRDSETLFAGTTWHKRYKGYQDMLKTGELNDTAAVLRDLLRAKTAGRKLSFGERQILEQAQTGLVKEIALAREVPEDEVSAQMAEVFAA